MNCEDLQLEDIVLLQLFKDQIMNGVLDQAKGEVIEKARKHYIFSNIVNITILFNK
jgi:hypothetical protein